MNRGVAGLILAGGRASRMGDVCKAQVELAGRPLIDHVIRRFKPQVIHLYLNIHTDPDWYRHYNLPLVEDVLPGYPGPLAGLWSGFCRLEAEDAPWQWLALAPCDGPLLPDNLVTVLGEAAMAKHADMACIRYGGELQPTFSLWHRRTESLVEHALLEEKEGGFKALIPRLNCVVVDWPPQDINPFFNINTPDDLERAEQLLEP